jgi:hypothetical protein
MGITLPGIGIVLSVVALLIIMVIVLMGHCSFNGSVGLGLH